jgi:hypothetical protein
MPKRLVRRPLNFVDRNANAILFGLSVLMVFTAIFAAIGWDKARNSQRRLTSVETTIAAERLGKQIADVTTCFNASRNRPRLILILRGISVELEPDPRQALNSLIDDYESSTPSTGDCIELARKNGIDPRPYLKNPPSDAGNGESR